MIGSQVRIEKASRPRAADFVAPSWARGVRGPLEWRQPHWRRSEWELRAGAEPLGTLVVRGSFRERTHGRGPSGGWEFGSRWTGEAWIAPAGTQEVVARFRPGAWGGGAITTASGFGYRWGWVGFCRPEYTIANESEFPCVRFRPRWSVSRLGGAVAIDPAGLRVPELEALVLLGWRLILAADTHAQ